MPPGRFRERHASRAAAAGQGSPPAPRPRPAEEQKPPQEGGGRRAGGVRGAMIWPPLIPDVDGLRAASSWSEKRAKALVFWSSSFHVSFDLSGRKLPYAAGLQSPVVCDQEERARD